MSAGVGMGTRTGIDACAGVPAGTGTGG